MSVFIALILGFIPSIAWLAFFLKEDTHPEPRKMIARAFLFGGMSALISLGLEMAFNGLLSNVVITLPHLIEENISVFIGFALIEEAVKFVLVYLAVRKSPYFDEPIDAMIYMVTGALGFAMAENFFIAYSGREQDILSLIVLRFIGATLLHALASGIIGHYWARGIKFKMEGKMIVAGVVLATAFHAAFNYLVFKFNDYLVYPTLFLIFVGFFVLYDFEELKKMEGPASEH